MTIRCLLTVLMMAAPALLPAQSSPPVLSKAAATARTFAVVVGISKYESAGIPQLEFAHKDAIFFSDYLQSKAGGAVPAGNIRLLVNEDATYGAIYDALDWLLHTCQKDDLVYFYFSGHGDMENTTIYNLGFLLSYNTPRTNYINSAVRIEDLNNIANTLSVKVNAKVVLITDACHSGNLAGTDNRGSFLVGDQLRTVLNKEIRITSCASNQLSAEDEGWGGGRGVFSYYLVNGMEGLADQNKDKVITVSEIKNYLDSSLSADVLLAERKMKQSPVIQGNNSFQIAAVDNTALAVLQENTGRATAGKAAVPTGVMALAPVPVQPQAYFFNLLSKKAPEEQLNFTELNKLTKEEIPYAALQMMRDTLQNSLRVVKSPDSISINSSLQKLTLLETTLRNNNDALNRFTDKLSVTLSDRGQDIINLYIDGDAAALERRRYYNSKSNGYDAYPQMFSVALKLANPSNYLYHLLQVKLHYFTGVAARLKMPAVANAQPLLDSALAEQRIAFALEENAAYIQNELGVLSLMKNDLAAAEKYFLRATQIAPQWVIPWSNLGIVYTQTKAYANAAADISKAMALKPDFQGSYISSGLLNEVQGNELLAEEFFRKSIYINSRHYLPFERLGYVYMHSTQYAKADSFFYEADRRKKDFHFSDNPNAWVMPAESQVLSPDVTCNYDTADIGKNDVMGRLVWGVDEYKNGHLPNAEKKFKEVIALDKTNPLGFHYLGRLLYFQKRWQEASIILGLSIQYYLQDDLLKKYIDSVSTKMPATKSKKCIIETFAGNNYQRIDDHFLAGRMYQLWNHFDEAEQQYRKIIDAGYDTTVNPEGASGIAGYYLLWNLQEQMGRFKDAEKTILECRSFNKEHGSEELFGFYQRMTSRLPESAEWHYRAGMFAYQLAADNTTGYPFDKKTTLPDTHAEEYIIGRFGHDSLPTIQNFFRENHFSIPAIEENGAYAATVNYPRTTGIEWLKKAAALSGADDDALADISAKTGDMYVWLGVSQDAIEYYKKSIGIKPDNAGIRMRLVDIYDTLYRFSEAVGQLDSLHHRHEINFNMQVLLAKYYIHESRFTEAVALLDSATKIHPYNMPVIADLNGRAKLLSGQPARALPFYKSYLALMPDDACTVYTIARIYAKTGRTLDAWNWLEMAMRKGFRYEWVLRADETWAGYRRQSRWTALQKSYPSKKYNSGN